MKTLVRALGTVGLAGLTVYLLRNRLLPPPVIEPGPAPIRGVLPPAPEPLTTPVADLSPDAATAASAGIPPPPEAPEPTVAPPPDDLTRLAGIGPVYAAKLHQCGIDSFADLAVADAVELAAATGQRRATVEAWIAQAGQLDSA